MNNLPEKVRIVEVGPRDGLQNESCILSAEDKILLIESLIESGLICIEAGSFVHPKWIPQMANSGQVLRTLMSRHGKNSPPLSFPALVPNARGFARAIESGAREIAIFAAASETFSQKNIHCSIDESLYRFSEVTNLARQYAIKVRGYISCALGCPYEGKIAPQKVADIAVKLKQMGCHEISLGDTIGVGTPADVKQLIQLLLKNMPVDQLAVHFHDTYGQALVNIYAALQLGIKVIDSSVAGLGGCPYAKKTSGNVATEDVVYMLNGLGIQHGVNLPKLCATGKMICEKLSSPIRSKTNLALGE